jgi:ABC-2 type transport system permease protein
VLAAKVVSFATVMLGAGAFTAVAAFLVARPILADRSIDVALADLAAWRGVAMATLATVGAGLLGLGAGLLVRHTAGASVQWSP